MINSSNKILFVILDNYKFERLGIQLLSSIALEEGYEKIGRASCRERV